jgi:hypothetical protein
MTPITIDFIAILSVIGNSLSVGGMKAGIADWKSRLQTISLKQYLLSIKY